jgi:hypothetical protein
MADGLMQLDIGIGNTLVSVDPLSRNCDSNQGGAEMRGRVLFEDAAVDRTAPPDQQFPDIREARGE